MPSFQRLAWATTLLPCITGSSILSVSALADDTNLPDKYAEAVLDVEGMT